MATSPPLPSPSLSSNAHFSAYTNGHAPIKPRTSNVSSTSRQDKSYAASITSTSTPEVHINGRPRHSRPSTSSASASTSTHTHDETTWGSHFWVTLVDPQVGIYPYFTSSFAALIGVYSVEPSVLLCVPSNRTGFMGSSCRKFRVRTIIDTLSDILPHGVNTPDCRPASMASGGRLATSRVAAFHTITTRRLAKPCGRNQMGLLYH